MLKGKDGTIYEVRVNVGEVVDAIEFLILSSAERPELWDQLSRVDENTALFPIMAKLLKGRLGQFLAAFVVPVDHKIEGWRDLEVEWVSMRENLGAFALPRVIKAFLASQEASDIMDEAKRVIKEAKETQSEKE